MSWSGEAIWLSVLGNAVIKGSVILFAAYALSLALRRGSAATRHVVWSLAVASLLLLPVFSVVLPSWEVPVQDVLPDSTGLIYRIQALAVEPSHVPSAAAAASRATGAVASQGAVPQPAPEADPFRLSWPGLILATWAAGAGFLLTFLALGVTRIWWMGRRASPLEGGEWNGLIEEVTRKLRLDRPVRVRVTDQTAMPLTWGLVQPEVLLPREANTWPAERRRVVLLHELAHVKRQDCMTQAIARVACSLYWFHPLAWGAARHVLQERERASDDLVLGVGTKASDYAGHLLEVARSLQAAPQTAWASVAMARRSQLEGRLLAILDADVKRGLMNRSGVISMAAAAACFVLMLAAMRPVRAEVPAPPNTPAPPSAPAAQMRPAAAQAQPGRYEQFERDAESAKAAFDYVRAEDNLRQALAVRESAFGNESAEYARGLVKLAALYSDWGKSSSASPLWQRALDIQEKALGPTHPELAPTVYHVGVSAHIQHEYETAERLYQRALGLTSDGVLQSKILTKLGVLYEMQDRPGEAETAYQRAITAGAGAPAAEAATTLEHYSRFLQKNGRTPEAESFRARAIDVRGKDLREFREAQDKAARRESAAEAYRVGGGVSAPVLLAKMEPEYSEDARLTKYQGTVVLSMEIGTDGVPDTIRVVRGLGLGLDEKAYAAVKAWRFQPGMKDGQPVRVKATVEVNFRLL